MTERAHRVEEMRHHPRAGAERGPRALGVGVAVPDADHGPPRRQRRDLRRRHAFGRDRQQQRGQTRGGAEQHLQILRTHRSDQRGIMGALARGVDMRPLEMQPEKPRHARLGRRHARLDHRARDLRRVGDQRRKQPGRSEPPVRGADGGDLVQARIGAEHDPAAAVHLEVDETGREDAAVEVHPLAAFRQNALRTDLRHLAVRDPQRGVFVDPRPVENPRPGENLVHHTVSVTLRRCGGASGSSPRRRARASMNT